MEEAPVNPVGTLNKIKHTKIIMPAQFHVVTSIDWTISCFVLVIIKGLS